ncbi:Hypothetical predicted protein [Mytilus galloprovincialis]|uniref:Tyr recombinase domain-containing protein n=1 Tax=Mytilus galloprovincialis TaxID=29158 RepID=A0A8B6CDH2_MYTGA|nr:Hypothetical predicted protein [Mytilus galloprovincialis]
MELFTDASSTKGFGGYFKGEWFYSSWPSNIAYPDKTFSMAFLELYPIVVSAILWGSQWTTKRILFWCDNEATVAIVKKGRSKCLQIMKLMRKLTWCACKYNFHFSAKHVPGYQNDISDALSRLQIDRFRKLAPSAAQHPMKCPSSSDMFVFHSDLVVLKLKQSKTDPFRKGINIQLHKLGQLICPYTILLEYIQIRKELSPTNQTDPLFITIDKKPLERQYFITCIKKVLDICGFNSSHYNGHSFRIGAATSAGKAKIEDHLIKTLGRWTSDSYIRYIRVTPASIKTAQSRLGRI